MPSRLWIILPVLAFALAVGGAEGAPGAQVRFEIDVSGKGTVRATWSAQARRVECRGSCTRSGTVTTFYVNAGTVVLKARAARTWRFTGWSRACRGSKPTCVLRVQRSTRVKATFVPPGARANPIPLGKAAVVRKDWLMKVVGVTPNANDLVLAANDNDPGVLPPPGAQDFMVTLTITYRGGGSGNLGIGMLGLVETIGSHNVIYDTNTTPCPGAWPPPSFKSTQQKVFSGQTVTGNLCYLIVPPTQVVNA